MERPEAYAATAADDAIVDSRRPADGERDPLIGQLFSGRYRIERRLGGGSMGEVYLAEHTLMHKRVAIKVLRKKTSRSLEAVARFEREAVAASRIDHPNVAAATDFGKLPDGTSFLVLEYVEGIGLRDALRQYGSLPARRALHIAEQICDALTRAHEHGIVHRDLKPENIMLTSRGDDPDFVKVLDFGIARVPLQVAATDPSETLTRVGVVYGTPEYMAPEQSLGHRIDARADLYALGVILYEMLTGVRPFVGRSDVLLMCMHATRDVPPMRDAAPLVDIAPEVEAFVRRLLSKAPEGRPENAYEAQAELRKLPASSPYTAWSPTTLSGEILAHATSVAPKGAPVPTLLGTRLGVSAALGLFVIALCIAIGIRSQRESAAAPEAPSFSLASSARLQASDVSRAAVARFERCEVEAGRAMLDRHGLPLDTAENHRAIVAGCFSKEDATGAASLEALEALTNLARLDAAAAQNPNALRAVERAATNEKTMAAAYAFLLEHPSEAVADVLYRLTFTPNGAASIARAEDALRDARIVRHASRALLVALALRDVGEDCGANAALLEEAETFGDGRALAHLERLTAPGRAGKLRGKKRLGPSDLACIQRDVGASRAMDAIKARIARGG
ncbi:MAG: serine/threonine-protein kinase [Polyangiaceae bacterium]